MGRNYKRYRKQADQPIAELITLALVGIALWLAWQSTQNDKSILYLSIIVIIAIIGVTGYFVVLKYIRIQQKVKALDIAAIDSMDPLVFEEYVASLLKSRGFTSVMLTERYDYGVDIIAVKDGVRWGVQVKRYTNLVKAEAVRQVVTALIRYKCDRAMVVTNSVFSRPARELAKDNHCVLVDRSVLAEWIVAFRAS